MKEKDQKIRKSEQEIDSLSFRNQQLTKRVNVLQDELEAAEGKGKKNKVCATFPPFQFISYSGWKPRTLRKANLITVISHSCKLSLICRKFPEKKTIFPCSDEQS